MELFATCENIVKHAVPQFRSAGYTISSARAVVLYFCFYGRNAWHSTWIERYTEGSITTTLEAAKKYAENNRKFGNNFKIHEIPAFEIRSRSSIFYIVQINTNSPFQGCLSKKIVHKMKHKEDATTSGFLKTGESLAQALETFTPTSPYWTVFPKTKDSILFLSFGYDFNELAPRGMNTGRLKSWQSISYGKKFYLDWKFIYERIGSSAVRRIMNFGISGETNTMDREC